MIRTPSITISCPVNVMSTVGGMRLGVPSGTPLPRPASIWPRGPGSSSGPNWYSERRVMAMPASRFSATVSRMKCSGATTTQRPASTSAWVVTPRTPPKWSRWLWV